MASKLSRPTRRDVVLAGSSLLVMAPHVARGQAAEPVRFSLEFRIYGGNAPLFLGAESGIFRDQGINVTMDGSGGSVESVTRAGIVLCVHLGSPKKWRLPYPARIRWSRRICARRE